jgi:hypothetical protein
MRRAMLMSAFLIPVVLLIAGVTYARTGECSGGDSKARTTPTP